jgi:hypothetical protein
MLNFRSGRGYFDSASGVQKSLNKLKFRSLANISKITLIQVDDRIQMCVIIKIWLVLEESEVIRLKGTG